MCDDALPASVRVAQLEAETSRLQEALNNANKLKAQLQEELSHKNKVWKAALAWQDQGTRSKWSTEPSLELFDTIEEVKKSNKHDKAIFELYREAVLRNVLAKDISDEHRKELNARDEQWEHTIMSCFKQDVKVWICANVLFWQDQYNMWGRASEDEAESYALKKLSEIQKQNNFIIGA